MRKSLILAAILLTASAQAQPWRNAGRGGMYPRFAPAAPTAPGRQWAFPLPYLRPPTAPPYVPPQTPVYRPVYRPPVYTPAPRPPLPVIAPFVPVAPVAPVARPVPVVPSYPVVVPVAPAAQPTPVATIAPAAGPAAPGKPTTSIAPEVTASPVGMVSALPWKLIVPVAGMGGLAWWGRRRMKGALASNNGNDFAELPH